MGVALPVRVFVYTSKAESVTMFLSITSMWRHYSHTYMQVEDHSNSSESTASLSSSDSGDDASSDSSDFAIPLVPKPTEQNICSESFSANNEVVVGNEHSLFALSLQDNVR